MRKSILALSLYFLFCSNSFCQDLIYSQFYEVPLLRNPALAGLFEGAYRVGGAHRSQWTSVTVPYQTSALDVQIKTPVFKEDFMTLGLQLTYDAAGDVQLKRSQLLPVLNFHKALGGERNNFLSLAFMGGPVQSRFNPSQARLDDQFINGKFSGTNLTSEIFSSTGYSYWDFSTGLSYSGSFGSTGKYYVGAGLFHLNQPKVNFFQTNSNTYLQKKLVFNMGIKGYFNDANSYTAFIDYYNQGGSKQVLGGLLLETDLTQDLDATKTSISGGAFYRWNDAFIPVIRLTVNNFLTSFSYDMNISKLKTASLVRGGFELTGSYRGFLNWYNSSRNNLRCPSF